VRLTWRLSRGGAHFDHCFCPRSPKTLVTPLAMPFGGGWAGSQPNTIWPGPRPTCKSSFILIHPTVWPQCTNVTERHDRHTDRRGQRYDSIGRTVLQLVAQKTNSNLEFELAQHTWRMSPHYLAKCRTHSSDGRYVVSLQTLVALKGELCNLCCVALVAV